MPEGPECKYISSSVNDLIQGNQIVAIDIFSGRYNRHGPPIGLPEFRESIKDSPVFIKSVQSHGKFIYWEFSNHWYLWNTLGMSGQWCVKGKPNQDHLHVRLRTLTSTGEPFDLWWKDIRNFGTLKWIHGRDNLQTKIHNLGVDILAKNPLSTQQWIDIARKKNYQNLTLPAFLMRQNILSGVGNYLKSEALYQCNISPLRKVEDLEDSELIDLYLAVRDIAIRSFESHGASFSTYAGPKSEKGLYGFQFQVYGCDTDPYGHKVIRYVSEDGRTTHWVRETQT